MKNYLDFSANRRDMTASRTYGQFEQYEDGGKKLSWGSSRK